MPNPESGLVTSRRGPIFQFYRDLDPLLNQAEIVQVTDRHRIAARMPNGTGLLFDGHTTSEQPAPVIAVNDVGQFILDIHGVRRAFSGGREIALVKSPVMTVDIRCLNYDGNIGGAVRSGSTMTGRIWSQSGAEDFLISQPNSVICGLPERGSLFAIGLQDGIAALFDRSKTTLLTGPDGEKAIATTITGAGISCGSYIRKNGVPKACLWDNHGTPIDLDFESEGASRVVSVLEDSSILVEVVTNGENSYLFGRQNSLQKFSSANIGSIEEFPLISVDAVSPAGIMVVTLQEPNTGRRSRALVGPESARRKFA